MIAKRLGIASKFNPTRLFRRGPGLPRTLLPIRRAPPKIYGRIGNLEVRLAHTKNDLKRAQRLRYQVFYEEMSAIPDALAMISRRDEDLFDPLCDHLLVIDNGSRAEGRRPWRRRPRVVGTYRILRQDVAEFHNGFYSQGEYDIAALLETMGDTCRFMELGRSCVLKNYRGRRTVELLWRGIWNYAREHNIGAMLGCASFEGADPRRHAGALSFLHHTARAPKRWRVKAHEDVHIEMNMLPASQINTRTAVRSLPPLIKGYLRVGAYIGDGAVIDHQFGTTDVFIILPVEAINERYFAHFGARDEFAHKAGILTQLN